MRRPINGDIVHYGSANQTAIVVKVESRTRVNLVVWGDDGSQRHERGVEHGDNGWTWPVRDDNE